MIANERAVSIQRDGLFLFRKHFIDVFAAEEVAKREIKEGKLKLLHLSDLHLGIQLLGQPLLERQRHFCDFLIQTIEDYKIDGVMICGDVFDRSVSNAETIGVYDDLMTRICIEHRTPVYLIAGNHDGAERLSSCNELLERAGLHIRGRLDRPIRPVIWQERETKTELYMLPFFNTEEVRFLYPEAKINNFDDAVGVVLDDLRSRMEPGCVRILMAHLFVRGGVTAESDRAAMIGGVAEVDLSRFKGFDYVALGHLHKPQQFENVCYAGSPLPYSFSEAGQEKSFSIFDTQTRKIVRIPIEADYRLKVLRGELGLILAEAQKNPDLDSFIKIEITDRPVSQSVYDAFRECYPRMLMLTSSFREQGESEISYRDIEKLSPVEMLEEYMETVLGRMPTEQEKSWFLQAMQVADREENQ